jgi:hypothetical protein
MSSALARFEALRKEEDEEEEEEEEEDDDDDDEEYVGEGDGDVNTRDTSQFSIF